MRLVKKLERLEQLMLIKPAALTLLILFNIPAERIHTSDANLDPNSQRDNLQKFCFVFFVKLKLKFKSNFVRHSEVQ